MGGSFSVLILGGTRYVGRRLVAALCAKGREVTVATRGRAPVPSGDRVRWARVDRSDRDSLVGALEDREWVLVYDQLCYAPSDAADVVGALSGRTGRYIMTSSQMVYEAGNNLSEAAFDPRRCQVRMGRRMDFDYGEGKRLAEAVLFRHATFPVATARFPVILGPDDYTGRLAVQIRHIRDRLPLSIPNIAAEMSLISSAEAADFLVRLGEKEAEGPFNAASSGSVSAGGLVKLMEDAVKQKAITAPTHDGGPFSLWTGQGLTLDTTKAAEAGYAFQRLDDWLPELVGAIAQDQGA